MPFRRFGGRKRIPRRVKRTMKIKKLVSGQGMTGVQRIAAGRGQVARLARSIAPIIGDTNSEHKYFDQVSSINTIGIGTPTLLAFTNMAQGTTDITRIGNSVKARSLAINCRLRSDFQNLYVDNITSVTFRLTLFVDKSKNGTNPDAASLAQMFQDTTSIVSAKNINFTDRFTILKDKFVSFQMQSVTSATNGTWTQERVIKWYIPLDFHIRYVGTSDVSSSIGPNNIYMFIWTNDIDLVALQHAETYSRFVFTDD